LVCEVLMAGKLILHDLDDASVQAAGLVLSPDDRLFAAKPMVKPCIGCFGCWVRTPGACVIKDRAQGFAQLLGQTNKLIVTSRLVFGGFAPEVKAVLDRSIGFILPYFVIRDGEMHHGLRYPQRRSLHYLFYGANLTTAERSVANRLIVANGRNFKAEVQEVGFFASGEQALAALRFGGETRASLYSGSEARVAL
jgi:hypothetical protein